MLIVSDPDAPGGTYVHVTRYGLNPRGAGSVDHGGREGSNSAGKIGWAAPCPPEGDDTHRYVWCGYALRDASGLDPGAQPGDVAGAVRDGVLAAGTISAHYVIDDLDEVEPGALWADTKLELDLGVRHHDARVRSAIVTDIDWMARATRLFAWMLPGEARVFPLAELAQAKAWVSGGAG